MKTLIKMVLISMNLLLLAVPVHANNPIERVILLYIDGFHPEAFNRYNLPNLELLKAGGTSAERGIMTLPVHPTIGAYGANHTTSLPNITTLAGTMFIDEKQHFFHHDLPDDYLTLHAGGSNAYRSMNDGFSYTLADAVSDKELIDFAIQAFEKEGDIQFSRIHLQQAGYAGRIESGKQQNNVPWAQNIFAEDSPYGKAVVNADKEIGRLFSYLKDKGKWDSTLIAFMGDGQAIEGWHLYMFEDAWLTPIVFHGPTVKRNHTIPYAENIDVIPSIELVIRHDKIKNFKYGVSAESLSVSDYVKEEDNTPDINSDVTYVPVTYFNDGRQGNDIQYMTRDEVIADVLKEYERFITLISDQRNALLYMDN